MSFVKNTVESVVGGLTGKTAQEATERAAGVQAGAQREALEFTREQAALPTELRDVALRQLGGVYGLPGFEPGIDIVEQARVSPLYQAQLAGIGQAGQEAQELLQSQAAVTGGVRGGNIQAALGDLSLQQNLARQEALGQAYQQQIGGLQGLAQLPTSSTQIAGLMSGIGQTQAQGIAGGAQARQQATGQLLQLGGQVAGAAMAMPQGVFSDIRLKDDVVKIGGTSAPGINRYSWEWNGNAAKLGLTGHDSGYIAQEVEQVWPDAIIEHESGYKKIRKDLIEERLNGG